MSEPLRTDRALWEHMIGEMRLRSIEIAVTPKGIASFDEFGSLFRPLRIIWACMSKIKAEKDHAPAKLREAITAHGFVFHWSEDTRPCHLIPRSMSRRQFMALLDQQQEKPTPPTQLPLF